jgi:hypothetical protein
MPVPRNRHFARFASVESRLLSVKLLEYGAALPARPALGVPRRRRLLEVATALVSLSLLTLPLWGSLFFPTLTAWLIVLFCLYWLYNGWRLTASAVIGYFRLRAAERRDWAAEVALLPGFERLWHLVIIPTYKEPVEVVAETLERLARQTFPRERLAIVLAFEARDRGAGERWQALNAAFAGRFAHLWSTFHPDIAGEVKGKSSNEAWAARWAAEMLCGKLGVPAAEAVVTTCDADSHFHPNHLSALSHFFLSDPDRHFKIFQPAILFYSNLWRLPLPFRAHTAVQSVGHLARLVPRYKLVNQSTYSLSLQSCREIGFWDPDVIPEDSHMFFKMFFHFGGRVRVEPIYLPIWADAAEGRGFWRGYRALYEQEKRWSWGVSDVPYVIEGFFRARHISWRRRVNRCGHYVQEQIFWPANWFLLALGTRLPEHLSSVHLLPQIRPAIDLSVLMVNLCAVYVAVAALIHILLAAGAPGQTLSTRLVTLLGLALAPVSALFLIALPALEAHLRLLLGRRLEYKVTEKLPPPPEFRVPSSKFRADPTEL